MIHLSIALSFIFSFFFMIVPLPNSLKWLRPDLVTIFVIYWASNSPNNVGVFFAFFVGLFFDLLTGLPFGSMGLSLGIVAFLTMNLRLRLRIYRHWQKFMVIMLLVACSQLIRLWIQMLVGHPPASFMYWFCSITSAVVWPVVFTILRTYQQSLKIT